MQKLILSNPLSPGDILMSTSAFRDLHLAHPGKYLTDFRVPSGCEQIFDNNPYITKIDDNDSEARHIRLDYSEIHRSGISGRAFAEAHTMDLAKNLGIEIPITKLSPDIFLSDTEKNWPNPVMLEHGFTGRYWLINGGIKSDYTCKFYPYYQQAVDLLKDKIQFVQIGDLRHNHPALNNVIDMRGRTDLRQLFRLQYHAQGVVCGVSLSMVIQNAFRKPCVVLAGARETLRWQIDGNCQYLYTNGCMSCEPQPGGGSWTSKLEDCKQKKDGAPLCLAMIKPEEVVNAIEKFYIGGRIKE